jgi:XS domain
MLRLFFWVLDFVIALRFLSVHFARSQSNMSSLSEFSAWMKMKGKYSVSVCLCFVFFFCLVFFVGGFCGNGVKFNKKSTNIPNNTMENSCSESANMFQLLRLYIWQHIGMGNQELLEYFSGYSAKKARHSYGPKGHRGISLLIFESVAVGYMEAERLHQHFEQQGTDRHAWEGKTKSRLLPGGQRQLFGYLAHKEDLDDFNRHCKGIH